MLANGTGQTTDTWMYDAWGETTSRTGVTENDYQYTGERFDRTTELYQFRARYGNKWIYDVFRWIYL